MRNGPDVIIIGGGLGGLLVASSVAMNGGRPLVLEAASGPGGVADTIREDGYILEPAAGSFLLPHPHLTPILDWAGAKVDPARTEARRRYVFNHEELHELAGPQALFSKVVSRRGKIRLLAEPAIRPSAGDLDESLQTFLQRRLGPEVGRLGATLMAHGVFAGDPTQISARAAFPALVSLEDEAGSLLGGGLKRRRSRQKGQQRSSVHVARNGMVGLANDLATKLGSRFRLDWPVTHISQTGNEWLVSGPGEERAPAVVVALAPDAASKIAPDPLRTVLAQSISAPVAVVGLGGRSGDLPLPSGFGALIGPDSQVRALGMLFESSYADGRAPRGHRLLKTIYGGAADPSVLELADEALVELAVEEAGQVTGVVPQPSWTRVIRHHPGIPQYNVGHGAWLGRLAVAAEEFPGLLFGGWAYQGIGLSSLAEHATVLAGEAMSASRDV